MLFKILLVAFSFVITTTVVSKHQNHRKDRTYDKSFDHLNNGTWHFQDSASGPKDWYKKYPGCKKSEQSPINIDTSKVVCDASLVDFTYTGYDTVPSAPFILNRQPNIHGVFLEAEGQDISISNGWFPSKFTLNFIVIYYGNVTIGSDHTFDGKAYAGFTFTLVHWNAEKYSTFVEAENNADGLVALETNVQVGDPSTKTLNEDIGSLADTLDQAIKANEGLVNGTVTIPFPLQSMLPSNRIYYKYHGSFPIPPCPESIDWCVFKESVYISSDQMAKMLKVLAGPKSKKIRTTRPVQPLNGRVVSSLCPASD